MGTGYLLSIGYLSGSGYKGESDKAWDELVNAVETLRLQPERIMAEARRLGADETCSEGCCTLRGMAEAYRENLDNHDGTLIIHAEEQTIMQLATGGDRSLKEQVRRAFCRLVIEDMHRQGIEVCLEVT